jgi:hypothetical protein
MNNPDVRAAEWLRGYEVGWISVKGKEPTTYPEFPLEPVGIKDPVGWYADRGYNRGNEEALRSLEPARKTLNPTATQGGGTSALPKVSPFASIPCLVARKSTP